MAGAIATDDKDKAKTAKNANKRMDTEMMIDKDSSIRVKKTKGKRQMQIRLLTRL